MKGSGRPRRNEPLADYHGLSEVEFEALARYNDERAHGIRHTDSYRAMMAELQEIWDQGAEGGNGT